MRFIWGLAIWCVLASGTLSRADIIYTTFGSGDSFDPNNEHAILGGGVPLFGYIATAMQFSPSETATFDAVRFAALSLNSGSITGLLAADSGGVPGSTLETLDSVSPSPGGPGTIFRLTSSIHPRLTAGSLYWYILEPTDPTSDLEAGWNLSSPPVIGLGAQTFDPAHASWQVQSNATQGAFEISGSPVGSAVPEPSTLLLLGLGGILSLAGTWWRRRGPVY
jgi:hypothetical protein